MKSLHIHKSYVYVGYHLYTNYSHAVRAHSDVIVLCIEHYKGF